MSMTGIKYRDVDGKLFSGAMAHMHGASLNGGHPSVEEYRADLLKHFTSEGCTEIEFHPVRG